MEPIRSINEEDILLWPDGSWCFYSNLDECSWMDDNFEVIPAHSSRWSAIMES